MKKIIHTIMIIFTLTLIFSACGAKESTKALKVGLSDDYAPMEFRDENNELVGFDIDFIKALSEQMGVEMEIVTTAWDGIFVGLNTEKYDMIISTTGITKERQESFNQSIPYLASGQVVVVNMDNESIKTVEDLAGKKIGVQIESTGDEAATKQSKETAFEITRYDDIVAVFNDISSGRLDACVVDSLVAMEYVAKNKDSYVLSPVQLTNEPLAVTMKKGNDDLKKKVDAAIEEMRKNGKLKSISEKWFMYDYTSNINEEVE